MKKVYCDDCYFYQGNYMRECIYKTEIKNLPWRFTVDSLVDVKIQNKDNNCSWFKKKPIALYRFFRSIVTFSDDPWEEIGW